MIRGYRSIGRVTIAGAFVVGMLSMPTIAGERPRLSSRIAAALDRLPRSGAKCGALVVDLSNGREVFSRSPDEPLIPASNQKLLVILAAVEELGADFAFKTVLGLRGDDLVIVGDGDPAIGDPKLAERDGADVMRVFDRWTSAMKSQGVTSIAGDLIVDESIFDNQHIHPSWETNDLQKWYAAPIGALNLNDNCIDVTAWPAGREGEAPQWSVSTPASVIELVNRAVTAREGVPVIARSGESFTFVLSGKCGSKSKLVAVPVPAPGTFFVDVFRGALQRSGISIAGTIRRQAVRRPDGALPADFWVLAEQRTPLADVLARIGKDSQNMFAECLAKRVGYEHARRTSSNSPQGSWATAAVAISARLSAAGIDTTGLTVADASGLSRDDRATPRQLVGVLRVMNGHERRDLFLDSLSVAGEDGSLRRRMKDISTQVLGKTGTLHGVRTLSGFVDSARGTRYAISILFNGIKGSSAPYKQAQDEICRALATHGE